MKIFSHNLRKYTQRILIIIGVFVGCFGGVITGLAAGTGAHASVTEKIPGANCTWAGSGSENNATPENRKYDCPVPEASTAIKAVIQTMIQYVIFIATLCGVLMLAVGGIMYSIGGATDEGKVKAKKFIVSSIAGLILLFFVSAILFLVAPWVYS